MSASVMVDRRGFLRLAGCAGLAGALPLVSPAIGLASLNRRLQVAQQNRLMMGTWVSVTVVDPSPARAQEALEQAFSAMKALTPVFDRHGPGLVRSLNQEHRLSSVPPHLARVLDLSQRVHLLTGGAFDITVAPLVDAFARSFATRGAPPSQAQIAALMAGLDGLRGDANGLRLVKEGSAVTLDGVAKGYIADQGLAAVKAVGCRRALINAGGDVAALGDRGHRPWRVAVADPASPRQAKLVVSMTGGALATSGDYEIYYDRERLFHHIVNPATGLSPRVDTSASVRAPSAALADALATACFVLKPEQALALVRSRPGLEALIYTRSRQRFMSKGFCG